MHRNVVKIAHLILAARSGKGPWMLWFPSNVPKYISRPIKTRSELQAFGSWLAADSPSNKGQERDWHNTIFKDYKSVAYKGKSYTKDQGRLLYKAIVDSNDWDAVDLGSPVKEEKSKMPSAVKNKVEQMKLDI